MKKLISRFIHSKFGKYMLFAVILGCIGWLLESQCTFDAYTLHIWAKWAGIAYTTLWVMSFIWSRFFYEPPKSKISAESEAPVHEEPKNPEDIDPIAVNCKDGFNSIAGYKEVKDSLKFVTEGLSSDKARSLLPHGLLLYGPPGTGKTLFARAIAGEAGIPFFYATASEFANRLVGQGASNVRALFGAARKHPVSIVFIDEIDAIGRARGSDDNQEMRMTLNQLLAELDGFNKDGPFVLTIAATNDFENLDQALTRSGRFDRKICVPNPKLDDRQEILKLHAKDMSVSDAVDFKKLAAETAGFSGSTLASIMREAGITALSRGSETIEPQDFDVAIIRAITKGEPIHIADSEERRATAFHEAGHIVAGKLLLNQTIPRATIMGSTSGSNGFTMRVNPEGSENRPQTQKELRFDIITVYAGRAAEKLAGYGENIGSRSDINKASELIKNYITKYGFGDSPINTELFNGDAHNTASEARQLASELYQEAETFVSKYSGLIARLANALLEKETLCDNDIVQLLSQ